MKDWSKLPIELKLMVVQFATVRDTYAIARTCREHYHIFRSDIFKRSDLAASTALSHAIREEAAKEEAVKREPDNDKLKENAFATHHESASEYIIKYILSHNHRALRLCHFWLAVELGSCSMVSRLAKESNIREEWEEFRDLDTSSRGLEAFKNLMMLAMKTPKDIANDLLDALLDLLKIDSSCNDEEGVKRLHEALNIACQHGKLELVKNLIALGAGPRRSSGGRWPLKEACKSGSKELFGFLLDSGASINGQHESPFHIDILVAAIEGDNVHIVQHLLDNKEFMGNMGNTIDYDAGKRLSAAFESCARHEIRKMIYERVNFEALEMEGIKIPKSLYSDLRRTSLDVIRLSGLEQAADDTTPHQACETLFTAIKSCKMRVVKALLANDAKYPPLFQSPTDYNGVLAELPALPIQSNKYTVGGAKDLLDDMMRNPQVELSIVKHMLANGVDPNPSTTYDSRPPLAQACYQGRKDIAEVLFHNGAVVEADEDGTAPPEPQAQTTLQAAVAGGHIEMVLWLLDGKAVIHNRRQGRDSWRSLCQTAIDGEIVMLGFLLRQGDAYLCRGDIEDMLKEAVKRHRVEIVQYLIEWFDFTKNDVNRMRLLHRARRGRRMIKTLQNYGADINLVDEQGHTLLHEAARRLDKLSVAILLCRGADTTIRDKYNRVAIYYARASQNVLEVFRNHDMKRQPKSVV